MYDQSEIWLNSDFVEIWFNLNNVEAGKTEFILKLSHLEKFKLDKMKIVRQLKVKYNLIQIFDANKLKLFHFKKKSNWFLMEKCF